MHFIHSLIVLFLSIHQSISKPNVLFIIIDDLRPSISCYSHQDSAMTPNIDQVASAGFVFNSAYSQQALCGPSRTSLLTSRRPDRLNVFDNHKYWRTWSGNFTTMPQYFKQHGYLTISTGKVFHPGSSSNYTDDYPLSWSKKPFHGVSERFKDAPVCPTGDNITYADNIICPIKVEDQPLGTLPDIETTNYATDFLKSYNWTKPLFMAIGYNKPHIPFKYPDKYKDMYPLDKIKLAKEQKFPKNAPKIAFNPFMDLRKRNDFSKLNLTFLFPDVDQDFQRKLKQSYFAAITYVDDLLGEVLQTMQDVNQLDNTILIITSDHGWSLGEHGEWAKYSNFDVALRVPLIISRPEDRTGWKFEKVLDQQSRSFQKISSNVELVDIFPTLVQLAGLPVIKKCSKGEKFEETCTEGQSLVPLLNGTEQWREKYPRGFCPRPSSYTSKDSDQPKFDKIRFIGHTIKMSDKTRFTEWVRFDPVTRKSDKDQVVARELYLDPSESINLAGRLKYQNLVHNMSQILWSD